jgi:hypothetical protein
LAAVLLGAAGAFLYLKADRVVVMHRRVDSAWAVVISRYAERRPAVDAFVGVLRAADGMDASKIEAAETTAASIPIPEAPDERAAFERWQQAEINVSVALADFFRITPAEAFRQNGNYSIALSRLEGTDAAADQAVTEYNQSIAAFQADAARGLSGWAARILYPDSLRWEVFAAFPDYGPLDGKKEDDD